MVSARQETTASVSASAEEGRGPSGVAVTQPLDSGSDLWNRQLPGAVDDHGATARVSAVGFGCWAAGGRWWGEDVRDDDVVAAMRHAVDVGINWFDTAPLYGHGHADQLLVRAFGDRLSRVCVVTKVGVRWDGSGEHAESDLSPQYIQEDTEASLRRLGLECIDLLQVHWPCERGTPLQDTVGALELLKTQGKIRQYGLCNYTAEGLAEANRWGRVATLQTPYNLLRREFEQQLQAYCQETALPVIGYEPLCRGLLTGKFLATQRFPESDLRGRDDRFLGNRFLRALTVVARLQLVAKRIGAPVPALALAWCLRNPVMTVVIAGAKRPGQVDDWLAAKELLARTDIWAEVDRIAGSFRG